MNEAVFISDLHLNPEQADITEKFERFLEWAQKSTKTLYILGDFFHVWPGDEAMDAWSEGIAHKIKSLTSHGIKVFYMHGNRDFLLGQDFAKASAWTVIDEPAVIKLGEDKVLLMHGDSYCTKDRSHQRFRKLTRNALFKRIFLTLPYPFRQKLVMQVRRHSAQHQKKSMDSMDAVESSFLKHMGKLKLNTLIHGHTHQPGLSEYALNAEAYKRYVLSDWDDIPQFLCYHKSNGLYFVRLGDEE